MPTASRTFRIFVSSTFEDLVEERNTLQRDVFPALRKLCEEQGARFQAIDLRWGVRDDAILGQRMMDTCLAEIERCQRTRIKPNFIVLLGDRYGRPPLPARIPKDEFHSMIREADSEVDRSLIESWYQRDDNAVPPEYLLKPRTGELVNAKRWQEVEDSLGTTLRRTAAAAGLKSEALLKYVGSASHQEIVKGVGATAEDRRHNFAFLRKTDRAKEPPELTELKAFLGKQLGENAVEYDGGEISNLCQEITAKLSKVILDEISRFDSRTALELETEAHDAFAKERSRHFVGRTSVLSVIADYLRRTDARPLIVHGPSGSGKSAIIAKASEDHQGVRRFIGMTPASSSGLTLLRSLCEEIGQRYNQTGDLPATFNELTVLFQDRLRLATEDRPLVLYLDALDQLSPDDPTATIDWLPPELPPHCRVLLSTINIPPMLKNADLVSVDPFSVEDAGRLVDLWLADVMRTLQRDQRHKLLDSFRQTGLPLYLKLAFEEGRRWTSFDPPEKCVLGDGLSGIIERLFTRLSDPAIHGPVLVKRALGYLVAARYGLTEDEMLDVLAADDDVWNDFEAARRHELPENVRRLPEIVWSRLHLDLDPYLSERTVPGATTISFYHRQLAERVEKGESYHAKLAQYFGAQSNWKGPHRPNQRKVSELPGHQTQSNLFDHVAAILTDLDFLSAKCAAGLSDDLEADYRKVLAALPETQSQLNIEARRKIEFANWAQTLIESAKHKRPPASMDIMQSAELWTDEQIAQESRRVMEHETRLDRVNAFHSFVRQQRHCLDEFGPLDGFLAQQAFNYAPAGPVHIAARALVGSLTSPTLLCDWPLDQAYSPTPALVRTLEGHTGSVETISLSVDGLLAVSGGKDNKLRVWDLDSGRCLRTIEAHVDWSRMPHVCMTPNGRSIIVCCSDGSLEVLDVNTGKIIQRYNDFSPVAKARKVWDTALWRQSPLSELPNNTGGFVTATADGQRAVSATGRRCLALAVWDLKKRRCDDVVLVGYGLPRTVVNSNSESVDHILPRSGSYLDSLCITPDSRFALVSFTDEYRFPLGLWDLESGTCVRLLTMDDRVLRAAMTPDRKLAVSLSQYAGIRIFDLESGECLFTIKEKAISFSLTPDGHYLVSLGADAIKVWDLKNHCCLRTIEAVIGSEPFGYPPRVCVTPDGRKAVSGDSSGNLQIWDLEKGQTVLRHSHAHTNQLGSFGKEVGLVDSVSSVRVSLDGNWIVSSGGLDTVLRVWGGTDGRFLRTLEGHTGDITALETIPDARALSASSDGTLRVWDLREGSCLFVLKQHSQRIQCACVTPDGQQAVSVDFELLCVWDLNTGRCVHAVQLEAFPKTQAPQWQSVRATTGGRIVLQTYPGYGSRLDVWDIRAGRRLHSQTSVYASAFTPDGRALVVADGGVGLSDPNTGATLRGGGLTMLDLETGSTLRTVREGRDPRAINITPDGRRAVAFSNSEVCIWDLENGRCTMCTAPYSRRESEAFHVWENDTGKGVGAFQWPIGTFGSASLMPNGKLVVSMVGKTAWIWELDTWKCRALVSLIPRCSAIDASGSNRIVFGTVTGEIRVFSLCFAPDGLDTTGASRI